MLEPFFPLCVYLVAIVLTSDPQIDQPTGKRPGAPHAQPASSVLIDWNPPLCPMSLRSCCNGTLFHALCCFVCKQIKVLCTQNAMYSIVFFGKPQIEEK